MCEEICRFCLKISSETVTIFSSDIPDIIQKLASIKVEKKDGLPSVSCGSCISDLYIADEIRNRIIESDKFLKSNGSLLHEETGIAEGMLPPVEEIELDVLEYKEEIETFCQPCVKIEKIDDCEDFENNIEETKTIAERKSHSNTNKKNSSSLKKVIVKNTKKRKREARTRRRGSTDEDVKPTDYAILTNESDILEKDTSCNPPKYSCKICNIPLTDKPSLHKAKHMKAKCNICNIVVRKDHIRKHVLCHKKGPQVCYICGNMHNSIEGLRSHMFYYHQKREKYKCDQCDAEFQLSTRLCDHKKRIHSGVRPYMCELCGKGFFVSNTLKRHKDLVHFNIRAHPCEYCKKEFSTPYALATHRRQHTGELPYVCEVCSAGFRQAVSLRTHMKSKHNIIVKVDKPGYTHMQLARKQKECVKLEDTGS